MQITDTHNHLYVEAFDNDRSEVIQRAIDKGIDRFFLPAIDSSYTEAMLSLQDQYPAHMYLMAGLHPTHVKENVEEELDHVTQNMKRHKYYAIGEIGIDLYWDDTFIKEQRSAFRRQIQLAREYDLPIVIHSRDSFDEIIPILRDETHEKLRGIFHCFTGTYEQALTAIELNMKLGIGGVVTFKNGGLDKFLSRIDLEHIVLETDAPYLAPAPFRGKRNEPVYISNIVQKMSEIYSISQEEIAAITTENSKCIFGI
ncbi:MAG: TatD family hydrolase [Flavobacteriaceae bacterium]|nr:TatD family hydrolase [Flavobacteriaceae bacterium]